MRTRSWLIIGLAASLAVNLALAGFLVGHLSRPGPAPDMLDPSLSLFRVVHQLPEERREAFRVTLRERFRAMRGDLKRMRRAQRDINQALEQEPFDAGELEAALAAFRAALLDGQQENHRMLLELADSMTAEERAALRAAMTRHGPRFAPGRRPSRHDER